MTADLAQIITPFHRRGLAAAIALLLGLFGSDALAQPPAPPPPVSNADESRLEVARLGFMDGEVEIRQGEGPWTGATLNQGLAIGDQIRTLRGGAARLDFPWTAVAVGDVSEVRLGENRVLSLILEKGRIDIDPEQTLLRIMTAEASISGSGRTLVRRSGSSTFVGSYNGGAYVEAEGTTVRLGVGRGTIVNAAGPPAEPAPLASPPHVISPAANPRYVLQGEAMRLVWSGSETAYHLEVLPIDSDVPVLSLDVEAREFDLRLKWLGTFRWRVSGLMGPVETGPSGEGLICVVEK